MRGELSMSMAGDQDVIESVARYARNNFVSCLWQMLIVIGVMSYHSPPFAFIRHRGADLEAAPAAVAGKLANANPHAARSPRTTRTVALVVRIAVAVTAMALSLSFVGPWLFVRHWRRCIVSSTWPPASFRVRKPFTAEVIQSDTGKLALVYTWKLFVGLVIVACATVPVGLCYFLSREPIVFGAVVLLIAVAAVRFPSRDRVASFIKRQQDLLDHERQKIGASR
jgi:hypothetical protein